MTIVAETYQFVVGVDTHARTHTFAVITTGTTALLAANTFPTTPAGMNRALAWVKRRCTGTTLMAIEGIGSYGAQLAHQASHQGLTVVEPMPTPTNMRAGHGKSDPVDAELIARSVTGIDTTRLRHPRQDDGHRAALRILVTAREQLNHERTAAINALTALTRTTDLGVDTRHPLSTAQIAHIRSWRPRDEPNHVATARHEAIRLARRVTICDTDLTENKHTIDQIVRSSRAAILLDQTGIGPITAAIILLAWSHPGRIRSEAAFAQLAGTAPIPASSGNTSRHRLNRSGDRRLNHALHTIILTRLRCDPTTRAYRDRKTTEGHTPRQTQRTLKRYLARQTYRLLNTTT